MKIIGVDIFRFSLPLVTSLILKGVTHKKRSGYLVRLKSETGACGWGEASPLPGFSRETEAEAGAALQSCAPQLSGWSCDIDMPIKKLFEQIPTAADIFPSVRFAIEMAVLNLVAGTRHIAVRQLFSGDSVSEIEINGLLAGGVDEMVAGAEALAANGFRTIKMKVGREDIDNDICMVKAVRRVLPEDILLRLDANRAWSFEHANHFAKQICQEIIEYIEEPLEIAEDIPRFMAETTLPVALDETLCEISPDDLFRFGGIAAVVIKPTLLGGFSRALAVARAAKTINAKVVISGSFDSGLTVSALAEFASVVCDPQTACGFDTIRWLKQDLLRQPISITNGRFPLTKIVNHADSVDSTLLTPVLL